MPGSPRDPLNAARFFLAQARAADPEDRSAIERNLEAVIVNGRSVWHYMQALRKRANDAAYTAWFQAQSTAMDADPLMAFVRDERNFILKERRLSPVRRRFGVALADAVIAPRGFLSTKVMRGRPWYRRSPRTLAEDLRRRIVDLSAQRRFNLSLQLDLVHRRISRDWETARRRWRERGAPRPALRSAEEYYLNDPDGKDRPAIVMLEDYLSRLDAILGEGERLFPHLLA